MELPPALRQAVDRALEGIALPELARAAETLSHGYRTERRAGARHLAGDLAARAYLATRLPATYATISASLTAAAEMRPDFAPRTVLGIGAGPGTAVWAGAERWASLEQALLVEGSAAIRSLGEGLAAFLPLARTEWRSADIAAGLPDLPACDLVTLAYVLNELEPEARAPLIDRLWALTADLLVIVERGTPAGWSRVLEARARLITAGAHLPAPCPHAQECPLSLPDWCHFSRWVARSRLHRQAKQAEVPWEDEKYIYIAASRRPGALPAARIIAPPRAASGRIALTLCQRDGRIAKPLVTRRDGAAYKAVRGLGWGDPLKDAAP